MRALPEGLDEARLCHAWILTRADETRLGFTDHDRDLVVDGVTCRAGGGWSPGAAESGVGYAPGQSAVLGVLDDTGITPADLAADLYDGARVEALRSSITRLLALQGQAGTVEDLIALETAISDRQAQLESLQAQERYYEDQVSLSTITLTLGSEDIAPVDEPDSFWTGLTTGWDALLAFLGGALVVVGVLLPWLLVLGLLALVAWAVVRRARARRVASTSDAQPVSASAGSDE